MYGVIDIGSNTIRLAIYEVSGKNIKLIFNKKNTAGLASYVNKSGALSEKGIAKAVEVLNEYKEVIKSMNLVKTFVFATASLRNITNSENAVREITEKTGFDINLVSGEQEGIYDFTGVSRQIVFNNGIMADVGGGSTELVLYVNGRICRSVSVPIGSLNLFKKFVSEIIPSQNEIKKMRNYIIEMLETVKGFEKYGLICAVGGSARAACKLSNQIFKKTVDDNNLCLKELKELISGFSSNEKEITRKILKIAPDRIHTILPGILILEIIAEKFRSDTFKVSSYGVREGYLYSKLFLEG